MFDQEPDAEECACCTELTGRAGMDEDSLHVGELGPFCDRCHEYIERETTTLRARIAELEREKGDFLSLLLKAYSAMREPNGDWQNIKLNECMVSIREKLPTT